jgi:leucyl-tRNA---protein transferase
MSIDFDFPLFLTPERLDSLLARGWFRMRESVFTTHYYLREGKLLSTVWLRSNLQKYQFSKSQRKMIRRLDQLYDVRISKLQLTEEHELLYQEYLDIAQGERADTIEGILGDVEGLIFQSMQIEIRHNGRLIGFSVFDCGANSIESIVGVYHPEFAEQSIGIYTMFLEVRYAIENDFSYYYIGYFTPYFPAFDYKLRLGGLQFFNPDNEEWSTLEDLDVNNLWSQLHLKKLNQVKLFLEEKGLQANILINVHYDTIILNELGDLYLEEPLFLDIRLDKQSSIGHLCYYSIRKRCLRLYWADFESKTGIPFSQSVISDEGIPIHTSLIRKTYFVADGQTSVELFCDVYGE